MIVEYLWSPINPCNKTKNLTCDEAADLSMNRAFLQVVDHCVGDPGQVTHVSSPSSALGSVIDR